MSIRLRELAFKAGAGPGSGLLSVKPFHLVVLVGPNNSGKTKALREISALCMGSTDAPQVVVENIDIETPSTADEILAMLRRFRVNDTHPGQPPNPNHFYFRRHAMPFGSGGAAGNFEVSTALANAWLSEHDKASLRSMFVAAFLLALDGPNRFGMIGPAPLGSLKLPPENHIAALFKNDYARERLRELVFDTFGGHLVLDPTSGGGTLELRVSDHAPATSTTERRLDDEAIQFFGASTPLSNFGDGVKAFVGILAPLIASDHRIILIDEPEAFLHPPHARRLGSYLADIAQEREGSVVVATHNADFLMGCLERGAAHITIVRLTYSRSSTTARALESRDIIPMFRDPLLRSTGLLNGMFHRSVVVTESFGDRAFYEEINRRLLDTQRGLQDCMFLNGYGKQIVQRLVSPLRKIGIPAAAIIDLDFLRVSNDTEWPALLGACGVPQPLIAALDGERSYILGRFNSLPPRPDGRDPLKTAGLTALGLGDHARGEELLAELARYGLFLVPGGELESWLPLFNIHAKKIDWCIKVFERLGHDPADPGYIKPRTNDVWAFLDKISHWTEDPARAGMT